MDNIVFDTSIQTWINNSGTTIGWTNSSAVFINWLANNQTYSVRMADFVRVTTSDSVYRFSTAPTSMTFPAVDSQPFDGLGVLVNIGEVQRDVKSNANDTSVTLIGIDTALLGWVLSQDIKGAKIEMWHCFFDSNYQVIDQNDYDGLYKYFTGYINSFQISEQWMEAARMFVGVVSVSVANIQIVLQNRTAGRFTNNNSWQFFNPNDTSMARVGIIETLNYPFGADGVGYLKQGKIDILDTTPTG